MRARRHGANGSAGPRAALRAVAPLVAAVGLLLGPTAGVCQLPWEYYKRRSLASVISQQHEIVSSTFAQEPGRRVFLGGSSFPSLSSIEYADSTRATSARRLELIGLWIKTYEIAGEAPESYETEVLFREDSLSLWLPVRSTLIEQLRSAVAPGDPLMLFVVWVGALGTGSDIDWVFLVYGFREGRRGGPAIGSHRAPHREAAGAGASSLGNLMGVMRVHQLARSVSLDHRARYVGVER